MRSASARASAALRQGTDNKLTDTPDALAVAGRARSGLVGLIPARPQLQQGAGPRQAATTRSAEVQTMYPPRQYNSIRPRTLIHPRATS